MFRVNNKKPDANGVVLPTNCLSVFDHFVGLALKGLNQSMEALAPD